MGKSPKIPQPQPTPPPPDPNESQQAKTAAAEQKTRVTRRTNQGSMNATLATSPEGVLGSAPISNSNLKNNLG